MSSIDSGCSDVVRDGRFSLKVVMGELFITCYLYGTVGRRAEGVTSGLSFPKAFLR